jgi:hypothetical protein
MKWIAKHKFGIWAFLVAVAFIPNIMSAAIVGRWATIAIGIPLVARIEFKFPFIVQFLLAMGFAWSAASVLYAPDRMDSLLQLFFMLMLIGVMGAASQVKSLDDAMTGLCIGAGISALFCAAALAGHQLVDQGSAFYAGLFYNSEVLSEFAAPLLVWSIVKRRWIFVPVTVLPLMVNNSRVALIAVTAALLIVHWPKERKNQALLIAGALLVSFGALYYFTTFNYKLGSAALRVSIWLSTAMAIDIPGHGIGWYRASHITEEFAHSDVLQAIAELGLGALCFAVIPFYALFRNRGTHVAERAAFIVVCVELVISFPLHVPASAFVAALLAGYLVSRSPDVRVVRSEGGIYDGADGEWHSPVWGYAFDRGRFRSFMVPVRCAAARISAMGSSRSYKEAS